jgi:hypothetical protein
MILVAYNWSECLQRHVEELVDACRCGHQRQEHWEPDTFGFVKGSGCFGSPFCLCLGWQARVT